jgi:branched-chain amino acid transport system permease protein
VQYWIIQTLNSLALGGLLFLLAAGFSLIFGLMRIANLTHGSMYMLGAYVGASVLMGGLHVRIPGSDVALFLVATGFLLLHGGMRLAGVGHRVMIWALSAFVVVAAAGCAIFLRTPGTALEFSLSLPDFVRNMWIAALVGAALVGLFGIALERVILRELTGNALGQVLVTLGISFIIADFCLMVWGGDPIPVPTPPALQAPLRVGGVAFPTYRLVVLAIAVLTAVALYFLMDRTRIGAMIRAGVDDPQMARAVGIPVSRLFTAVFCLGAALAGAGGIIGGPIMSAYPGLDADMLPLALIVVMLGGVGSLLGAFVGSFLTGAIYTFGTALLPDLAYVILFLPMIFVIAFRPRGLFGRQSV